MNANDKIDRKNAQAGPAFLFTDETHRYGQRKSENLVVLTARRVR